MLRNLILRAKASSVYRLSAGRWVNRRYLRNPVRVVNSLYKAAFGRRADPQGLADRVRQLQSGVPLETLAEELVHSPEFQTRHGTSRTVDPDYLSALYRDGLQRKPDEGGLAQWLAAGAKGATRAQVLAAFAASDEALERAESSSADLAQMHDPSLLVNSLYRTALGRDPDPEGLENAIQHLQLGGSLESLAERVAASREFQARHGSSQNIDFKYLTALLRDGFGRQPDLGSIAFWLIQAKNETSRATVLAGIASSDEARARVRPSEEDSGMAYRRWVTVNDTISDADRAAIRAHIAVLPFRPLVSVVMAIGKTSPSPVRESLHSVITQLYPHWELCIAVDPIAEPLWTSILSGRAKSDPRIRLARPGLVESTAAITNGALELAKGEFVA